MFGKHVIIHSSSRRMPGSRKRKSSRHYFIKCLILIIILSSCSLFKKTTMNTSSGSFDLSKQAERKQLNLKTMQKETQIYSWWNDSMFYQYEVIKEEVDQAKAATMKTLEKQEARQEQTVKVSKPIAVWIYAGIVLGIIGFVLVFWKLVRSPLFFHR